jgi:adenine-specific DNA methylase
MGQHTARPVIDRIGTFFRKVGHARPDGYIFARSVPCPDTGFHTPLVPDWFLRQPKGGGTQVVAVPQVDGRRQSRHVERDDSRSRQVRRAAVGKAGSQGHVF